VTIRDDLRCSFSLELRPTSADWHRDRVRPRC
jgi:hypothetical protein